MGDLCEVYLQDALLPQTERFVFLDRVAGGCAWCVSGGCPASA